MGNAVYAGFFFKSTFLLGGEGESIFCNKYINYQVTYIIT